MAYITYISGPVVKAKLEKEKVNLYELSYVGKDQLIGEVVELKPKEAIIQVYENTEGLKLKEPVTFSGSMLSAELGAGLLGNVFDGIQRPLNKLTETIKKGVKIPSLNREKKWEFKPTVKKGELIKKGKIIGEVLEGNFIHKIIFNEKKEGKIKFIAEKGKYKLEDIILELEDGTTQTLIQKHPVRIPREIKKRIKPEIPLITGQRIIDFLFPISKGGTASIPGGFGTGKTILQQTLAKWSDADIIVYIGCGERGNEMTEVLEEFPQIEDPKTGKKLIERTILIANTSDMPVSARESSIYMGITIAEYYRDMGYHVALMADSTSRWAEAMREISGRLNELPVEEGFPAYLSSKIGSVYERAGFVETISNQKGSLSIIGAVSPPGGDFSEPVTRHTRKFTSAFWVLDKELANARIYPAINYTLSYSSYVDVVKDWWEQIDKEWYQLRKWLVLILQEDDKLQRIVKLLGSEAIPEDQKLIVETANIIKEVFLQQNAFDPVDMYCPPERQIKMAKIIKTIFELWKKAFETKNIPVKILKSQKVISEFIKSKFEITNEEIKKYNELEKKIIETYENLISTYGE